MLRALIKKQILELSTQFLRTKKAVGTMKGAMLALALYILIAFSLLIASYDNARVFGEALFPIGLNWIYFAFMGIYGIILGTLISMFSADLSFFRAKDNEFLLSMPIAPWKILFAKMTSLYILTTMFSATGAISALAYYNKAGLLTGKILFFGIVMIFAMGLFTLAISCILGYVVAIINNRFKNNSMVTTAISVVLLGVFYYYYFQINKLIAYLIENSASFSAGLKTWAYPVYLYGMGLTGDTKSFIFALLIAVAIFLAIYFVMTASFVKFATASHGSAKKKYRTDMVRAAGLGTTLLKKEFKRFTSSSIYMMNCGLGSVIMLGMAVAAIVKADALRSFAEFLFGLFFGEESGAASAASAAIMILAALLMAISTMNNTTGPSVSLEGKSIWILQSLPVKPIDVFMAKIKMQLYLTVPPMIALSAAVCYVLGFGFAGFAVATAIALCFIVLDATAGLALNVKRPSLDWTNEAAPIKQSLNTMILTLGGWLLTVGFIGLYVLVGEKIGNIAYSGIISCIMIILSAVLFMWLKGRGSRRFSTLS